MTDIDNNCSTPIHPENLDARSEGPQLAWSEAGPGYYGEAAPDAYGEMAQCHGEVIPTHFFQPPVDLKSLVYTILFFQLLVNKKWIKDKLSHVFFGPPCSDLNFVSRPVPMQHSTPWEGQEVNLPGYGTESYGTYPEGPAAQ